MAHVRQKLRFEPIGLLGFPIAQFQFTDIFFLHSTEFVFHPPALRDVANDDSDAESGWGFHRTEADLDGEV